MAIMKNIKGNVCRWVNILSVYIEGIWRVGGDRCRGIR